MKAALVTLLLITFSGCQELPALNKRYVAITSGEIYAYSIQPRMMAYNDLKVRMWYPKGNRFATIRFTRYELRALAMSSDMSRRKFGLDGLVALGIHIGTIVKYHQGERGQKVRWVED